MNPATLSRELRASREHLTRITADLAGERLLGPKLAIVNPPLWELGHVAWFQEYWCLRRGRGGRIGASLVRNADALYDSAKVAHDTRWDLPLPGLEATLSYQAEVLENVIGRLAREPDNRELHYFAQLAIFHENMHAEAFHYTRQTLGYEDPYPMADGGWRMADGPGSTTTGLSGDVELNGGGFQLGAQPGTGFVFDNEKWAHEVTLPPFRIARAPVTNAQFLDFVECGGYARREWWSDEGWAWRSSLDRIAPVYWIKRDGAWTQRRFGREIPLVSDEPVFHVNWHEAQAYCRYAHRRLPTEAEWEYAASWDAGAREKRHYPWGSEAPGVRHANLEGTRVAPVDGYADGDSPCGCRQMIGNVWEWTASTFGPYPGFVADPYKEYSEPWFGTHKVLRGGSFATPRRLIRNTWRNFYTPDRHDVFAGFRTCANE
jgi:gamma-glutamyl hercynylcysteine S-oxide synthase